MHLKNMKLILTITIGVVICFIGLLYANYRTDSVDTYKNNLTDHSDDGDVYTETTTEQTTIVVYITGEVNKPDVYSLAKDSRLVDLVEKAGGFTDEAYIDDLNLAQMLNDGEKIVVQSIENISEEPDLRDAQTDEDTDDGMININTADKDKLDSLPGIGEKLADAIIAYREEHGEFSSVDEIKEVDGIGDGIYEKIKDSITID